MAITPDSGQTILPFLKFGGTVPLRGYTGNQHANDNFVKKNALNAEKFNEFERLFYNLCLYMGDIVSGFGNKTVGRMVMANKQRIDNALVGGGAAAGAGAYHSWLLGGNVFADPDLQEGNNVTEPLANGFSITLDELKATVAQGTALTGDSKGNAAFAETFETHQFNITPVEFTVIGTDDGVSIAAANGDWADWIDGEEHAVGAGQITVQLDHKFIKNAYFTGVANSTVVAVANVGAGEQHWVNGDGAGKFNIDRQTGIVSNFSGNGWEGETIKFYYVYYAYRRDWVFIKNSGNEAEKIQYRRGASFPTLHESLTDDTYWETDSLTYETLPDDSATETLVYEIILYPWNTLVDTDFIGASELTLETNFIDHRKSPGISRERWAGTRNGVITYPSKEMMNNHVNDGWPEDYTSYRTVANSTFNTYFGTTENVINMNTGAPSIDIFSDAKALDPYTDFEVSFYAYCTHTSAVTLNVSLYNSGEADTIITRAFSITGGICKYSFFVQGTSNANIYGSKLRLKSTGIPAGKSIFVNRPSVKKVNDGLTYTVTGGTLQLSCKSHSVLINGHYVMTNSNSFDAGNTGEYAAVVADIAGDMALRQGTDTYLPKIGANEAYVQCIYIEDDTKVFSVPFKYGTGNIIVARSVAELQIGLALQRAGVVSYVATEESVTMSYIATPVLPAGLTTARIEASKIHIVDSSMQVADDLFVQGDTELHGTLGVTGQADFADNVNIQGDTDIDGNTAVGGQVDVVGDINSSTGDITATAGNVVAGVDVSATEYVNAGIDVNATRDITAGRNASIVGNITVAGIQPLGLPMTGTNIYVINTQAKFEQLFGSSYGDTGADLWGTSYYGQAVTGIIIPEYTTIVLSPCLTGGTLNTYNGNRGYILYNRVYISKGVQLIGFNNDDTIVTRGNVNVQFITSYMKQNTTNAAPAGVIFPFDASEGDDYEVGDLVHWSRDYSVYTVIAQTNTNVTVDRDISNIAGNGALSSMVTGLKFDGWAFDGRGGVNGLGGSYSVDFHGGFMNTKYCGYSEFTNKVINIRLSGTPDSSPANRRYGGAYTSIYGGHTVVSSYKLELANISNCAAFHGGAVSNVRSCKISNIRNCSSFGATGSIEHGGGACWQCNYSEISNIRDCTASRWGGAVTSAYYSEISNIRGCTGAYGGAVAYCDYSKISNIRDCHASDTGGACNICSYSEISNIYNCTAGTRGGATYQCSYSKISNIHNCSTDSSATPACGGGACSECSNSEISNIFNCSSAHYGGAAYRCGYSIFYGIFKGNTAVTSGDVIHPSAYDAKYWSGFFAKGLSSTLTMINQTTFTNAIIVDN